VVSAKVRNKCGTNAEQKKGCRFEILATFPQLLCREITQHVRDLEGLRLFCESANDPKFAGV
jgi:hypothetical protein